MTDATHCLAVPKMKLSSREPKENENKTVTTYREKSPRIHSFQADTEEADGKDLNTDLRGGIYIFLCV